MKTTLYVYSFNTDKPEDREPCHQLMAKLRSDPGRGHRMHAIKIDQNFNPEPGPIELEPEFLFENQWNSDKGRVFDWYEEAIFSPYNGKPRFNVTQNALGSCYLKESELHLLRLLPVSTKFSERRAELTEEERAYLLPLYIAAQTKTTGEMREKQIAEIKAEYENDSALALTERDGKLWLLEHGIPLENCIFYNHTGRFGFGWRSSFTGAAREALLAALAKFPFPYDVA